MAGVEIDALNLERSITALTGTIRESKDDVEDIRESLASIADCMGAIADSLHRIANVQEGFSKAKAKRKPRRLKAVGS